MSRQQRASFGDRARPRGRGRWLERPGVRRAAFAILALVAALALLAALVGDLPEGITDVGDFASGILHRAGAPASLALLYLEESGIPLPVPGDVYVVYLGTVASGSAPRLVLAWLAIVVVVVAGSSNLYLVSRRWGHRLVTGRAAALLHLDASRLAQVERWLRRWGALTIIFGRHVPGFRVPVTVLAGAFEVPYRVFAPSVAVSTAVWAAVWLWLGARFGPRVVDVLSGHRSLYLAAAAAMVVVVALLVFRLWRQWGRAGGEDHRG